ncbi:MAG: hypothetical protein R3F51_22425 [Cyanobacteriota/Melainabacteria group bacterium]
MSIDNPDKSEHRLDDDEIIALIEQMFAEDDIGFAGHQNSNGADWYECHCCRKENRIKGHACGNAHILSYEHEPDCNAVKLYNMLQAEERDVEAIITLFEEMINAEEIALAAYQNWNGADWYECPSCRKETKVKGHAFGTMHLIMGDHEDSCTAMKIYRALELRADTDD